ncbi:hypothetical protein NP493_247g00034 [Ridgeia piscesae]|uniref:Uncharacterized protein n=1 Tax=Ridgeia piscesae TaxID=27915 RepID=A0AAD9NYY7_RIDPI|nr:hypothetical protein NP493_247g00034 [Ridgeia piscesae]
MALTGKDIMEMVNGFQKSQILYSASSLGLFEALHASSVPLEGVAVANKLHTNLDATERLMNACVGLGFLEKEVDNAGTASYSLTPTTEKYLVGSSPMSLRPLVTKIGDMYCIWQKLSDGIKDGQCKLGTTLGVSENYFDTGSGYFSTKSKQLEFLQAMHTFSSMDAPSVCTAFDLSAFKTMCDLGGATGAIAVRLAKTYPDSHVTLFDLGHVVDVAHHFMPKPKPQNMSFVGGDFFADDLPPSDLYVVSHVLHDWREERVNQLLRRIYNALRPGGAILVFEKILNEDKNGPLPTLLFDLGMLIACEGRERSAHEYTTLLEENGFCDVAIKMVPQASFRDAILARKF